MHLHRVTPDAFESQRTEPKFLGQTSTDFEVTPQIGDDGKPMVKAKFPKFGGGTKRTSDFDVLLEWSDVELLIDRFCEVGNDDASMLREAWKVAQALKSLGWREPQPHSN
jgi:hypothetical protein